MIIACVIAFNEERLLPGCLESLRGQVDRIVVVDGAFALYDHAVPFSTDNTRSITWCYGAEWVECPRDEGGRPVAWQTQVDKRNAYLVGDEGDWYFVIDADERLEGRLPDVQDGQMYAFNVFTWQGFESWTHRLMQHRGRMRYEGSHNALWSDDRLLRLDDAIRVPRDECRLGHLSQYRTEDQQLKKRRYYAERIPIEKPYRDRHHI